MHQHRLSDVVGMVSGQKAMDILIFANGGEPKIAQLPGQRLLVLPFGRSSEQAGFGLAEEKLYSEFLCKTFTESGVLGALHSPDPVIKMQGDYLFRPEILKGSIKQRQRIGAAGTGHGVAIVCGQFS